MTKTCAAFRLTAEGLWKPGFRVYLWTFTFAEVVADWEGSRRFSAFLNLMRMSFTECKWGGVKVSELHREHGIHFHCLIDRRLPVDVVRRMAHLHGFGRIHVCVGQREAAKYLSKYLSKHKEGALCESGRKQRRWAAFGDVDRVRVSDLINDSPQWIHRRAKGLTFTGYNYERRLQQIWDISENVETFDCAWRFAVAAQAKNTSVRDRAYYDGMLVQMCLGRILMGSSGCLVRRQAFGAVMQPF